VVVWEMDEALERAVRYANGLHGVEERRAVHPGPPDAALGAAFERIYGSELAFIPARRVGSEIRRIVRSGRRRHADHLVLVLMPERAGSRPFLRPWSRSRAERVRAAVAHERGAVIGIVPTLPVEDALLARRPAHDVLVLVDSSDIVGDRAVAVGRLISRRRPRFVHLDIDGEETERLQESWNRDEPGTELETEVAPIRELADAAVALVRTDSRDHQRAVTVVMGDVVARWWQRPLHTNEARSAKAALRHEPGTVLIEVPYQL
jgi:hypothetical protein